MVLMYLIKWVKSVASHTRLSDFGTKNPGLYQSVTSDTWVKTPLSRRSWMVSSAGSSYRRGTCLTAKTLSGFAFSLRLIIIGVGVFIGVGFRLSLRTS